MNTKTEKKDRIKESAERFARDTDEHTLTVVKDDGLYRHLKARRTADDGMSWFCWFEVVTWPGALVVRGDCGTFTFARIDDMFKFFRFDGGSINPHYWAEKTPDFGASAKTYSEDVFRDQLTEALADYERDNGENDDLIKARALIDDYDDLIKARALIDDYELLGDPGYEETARELLHDIERDTVVLADTWEWDLKDWDWQFLWCCHAIVWAITQYDEAATALERAADDQETE